MPNPLAQSPSQAAKLSEVKNFLMEVLPGVSWTSWHLFHDDDGESIYSHSTTIYIQDALLDSPELLPELMQYWESNQGWREPKLQHAFLAYLAAHHSKHKDMLAAVNLRQPEAPIEAITYQEPVYVTPPTTEELA